MESLGLKAFGDIFRGKRVLITGHTGFKGSWLALWLHELEAEVTGFALPPDASPSHFELIGLRDIVNHIEGDIRDPHLVNETFEIAKPDIVFHLAAQALVRDSYDDPKKTFDTNIGGTVNVLEAVRASSSVKAAVVITSDKSYENKEWVWGYRENDPMGGHDPYSASKGATEIVCSAYLRSFFDKTGRGPHMGFATVRAGNVVGGGDWATDRIIPDCIRALSENKPIVIRNPNSTRPWQHVLDPLSGYLFLAQQLFNDPDRFSGAWNFGPADIEHIHVEELAKRFIAAWGMGRIEAVKSNQSAPHEANLLRLSIDKAACELGWFPALNGSTAIDWTVNWYKDWHRAGKDMRKFSLDQIHEYTGIALGKNARWAK
ncbi:MAG: CDP-glucose 4,6-dehydratase [Desulfobacteraceae bacterium]|nr:CDP-glucose 4,6-dehydratase [Desulfobacteraceae bacterium]